VEANVHPIAELSKVGREFHNLQGEQAREGVASSRSRGQRARLEELEERFETLLQRWVSVGEQERWRAYLYRIGDEPRDPVPAEPPLFRGRSEHETTLVIRADEHGQEWVVDGALVARRPSRHPVAVPMNFDGLHFHEVFEAAPEALEALLEYVERRMVAPPWQCARTLYEDGLIDSDFGLTARGRRFRTSRGY
jgi:hypothetical protein